MADRKITALYRSKDAAEQAKVQLKNAGVSDVDIHSADSDSSFEDAARAAGEKTRNLVARIAEVFGGHEDSHAYAEGVRRGAYLLTAKVDETHAEQGLKLLQATDAVDVDQETSSWRTDGWSGPPRAASQDRAPSTVADTSGTAGAQELARTPSTAASPASRPSGTSGQLATAAPRGGSDEPLDQRSVDQASDFPSQSTALKVAPAEQPSHEVDRATALQASYGSETPGGERLTSRFRREPDRSDARIRSYVVEGSAEDAGDYQLGGVNAGEGSVARP